LLAFSSNNERKHQECSQYRCPLAFGRRNDFENNSERDGVAIQELSSDAGTNTNLQEGKLILSSDSKIHLCGYYRRVA
jgi:hypothetical protein